MEKAFLDILLEERDAVKDVNKVQYDIEYKREYREHIIAHFPDCDAKTRDIELLDEELVQLAGRKLKYEAILVGIRRELALCIDRLNS